MFLDSESEAEPAVPEFLDSGESAAEPELDEEDSKVAFEMLHSPASRPRLPHRRTNCFSETGFFF